VIWRLVISSPPRTKKTSNVLAVAGRRRVVLPSQAWRRWARTAEITFLDGETLRAWYANGPILCALNCRALFYRDADRGDAVGFYQGLADLLEQRGVVENDRQIRSWDGSRLLIDRTRPRVELVLEPVP
jgi:hypothetical protein